MFDCDSINKDSKRRRYIYDMVMLAAVIFIGIVMIFVHRMHTGQGAAVRISMPGTDGRTVMRSIPMDTDRCLIFWFSGTDDSLSLIDTSETDEVPEDISAYISEMEGSPDMQEDDISVNVLVISDGKAYMAYASCPDLVCVHTKAAQYDGDTICCLPHRLIVTVEADDAEGEADEGTW